MKHREHTRSIVVMGVSGSGKSTIGSLLARSLNSDFCDGDDLHPAENVARMAAGHPLGDSERLPWLRIVGERLESDRADGRTLVLACSALKHSYRDILHDHVPDTFFVYLDGPMHVVRERIGKRNHEFMPTSLLASQYASLEPLGQDERGVRVDIRQTPEQIVDQVMAVLDTALRDLSDRV